eukprot:scaffold157571_cov35-Tisochrysis_lutea.AAC.2
MPAFDHQGWQEQWRLRTHAQRPRHVVRQRLLRASTSTTLGVANDGPIVPCEAPPCAQANTAHGTLAHTCAAPERKACPNSTPPHGSAASQGRSCRTESERRGPAAPDTRRPWLQTCFPEPATHLPPHCSTHSSGKDGQWIAPPSIAALTAASIVRGSHRLSASDCATKSP